MVAAYRYAREPLLHWARSWLPDLRIGYALLEGERRAFARFSWAGEPVELEAADEDALVLDVANGIREQLGLQPLGMSDKRTADEAAIVAAALRGSAAEVDALTLGLVASNAAGPSRAAPSWVKARTHDGREAQPSQRSRFARW